jgi:hypothetical protein
MGRHVLIDDILFQPVDRQEMLEHAYERRRCKIKNDPSSIWQALYNFKSEFDPKRLRVIKFRIHFVKCLLAYLSRSKPYACWEESRLLFEETRSLDEHLSMINHKFSINYSESMRPLRQDPRLEISNRWYLTASESA